MNKLILALFVVVCVVVVNAQVLNAGEALYDTEEALYDTDDNQVVGLVFPSGCKRRTLYWYARNCLLKVTLRWNGWLVRDPASNRYITRIPWIVSQNQRCRTIINALRARCEAAPTTTTTRPKTTRRLDSYHGEAEYYN